MPVAKTADTKLVRRSFSAGGGDENTPLTPTFSPTGRGIKGEGETRIYK